MRGSSCEGEKGYGAGGGSRGRVGGVVVVLLWLLEICLYAVTTIHFCSYDAFVHSSFLEQPRAEPKHRSLDLKVEEICTTKKNSLTQK